MNQELIGKVIKEIRKKENLSQQKFANKYGVTYQAVSKWETGKNMPDITILKQICNDYNLDINDFLDSKITSKKPNKKIIYSVIFSILLLIIILGIVIIPKINKKNNDFEFKTLSTNCNDFNLYGSIAYNDSKLSIYISHIIYCGEENNEKYKKIESILYERVDKTKTEIDKLNYTNEKGITIEEYLKDKKFSVDNYENTCELSDENSLYLEINATNLDGQITTYKIPLILEENCNN